MNNSMNADNDFLLPSPEHLPPFKGDVFIRSITEEYLKQCYQYGSSSHTSDGIVQPAAIVYATDDEDVIMAIKYAEQNTIALAVRTGGHQYSCASSTYGRNILLDLSQMYTDFIWQNHQKTEVTVGISYTLSAFNAKLGKQGRFVPHGQCSHVRLGGHVQTGGFGQLGRSFGLLADHVTKLRIITAAANGQPAQARWVYPGEDLFFAVLGGSPGNFGVLTHITLSVYKDDEYKNSRGFKAVYLYTRDRLKCLLDVMVEMAEDAEFPGDFDYCITMVSQSVLAIPSFMPDMDEKMRRENPQIFGETNQFYWPPAILVYAQWANLGKQGQVYDPTFFNKIKAAGGHPIPIYGIEVDDNKPTPMSKLTTKWIFKNVREFEMPYVKRTYMSNSKTFRNDGWTDWVCNRIDKIQSDWNNGCKLAVQIQHFGGLKSQFCNKGVQTAISWRDSNICCVLDCFHSRYGNAKDTAEKWQEGNDTEGVGRVGAKFCVEDRRLLWGSNDLNMDPVHPHYYDENGEKYARLCKLKRQFDPNSVFTANGFCVGAPPVVRHLSDLAQERADQLGLLNLDDSMGDIAKRLNRNLLFMDATLIATRTPLLQMTSQVTQQASLSDSVSSDVDMAAELRLRWAAQEQTLLNHEERDCSAELEQDLRAGSGTAHVVET